MCLATRHISTEDMNLKQYGIGMTRNQNKKVRENSVEKC